MVGGLLLTGLLALPQAHARAGYSQNHPNVRYRTLETEHFFIHWPESTLSTDDPHYFTTEFTAAQLAFIAEDSYDDICGSLDYYLDEKVHVVVYDQDNGWEGNGFAIAEWDWTGFAARWGSTFRQRGRMEFLSDVFVHEFAHIVSLKAYLPWSEGTTGFQVGGLVEDEEWLRRWGIQAKPHTNVDVGVDLLITAHTPFWWAEGGAEYWSHEAGYNWWGTSRDAFLRMSTLEDRLLDHDEWTTRADKSGFDGERGYNQGYAMGLYLRERFGRDVMTEMAHVSSERWHWSWDSVVEETTGVPSTQLYQDYKRWLEQRYAAQEAVVLARGLAEGRELAFTQPAWEAVDEDWEALSKKQRDAAMDGDTAYAELPTWSPDGRFLTWFESGLNIVEASPADLGALSGTYLDPDNPADRKALRALDHRSKTLDWAHYYRPAWSPDGTRFVVPGPEDMPPDWAAAAGLYFNADGYDWNQLVVVELVTDKKKLETKHTQIPGTLRATEAAWSPDGQRIAFVRYGDGTHNLWTIGPDGSDPKALTEFRDGTQIQGISYTPDGTQLLVSLFRNFRQDLWLVHAQSGVLTKLTETPEDETDPIVGPDGRAWFTSDVDHIFNVYAMDLGTGEVRKQTEIRGGAYGAYVTAEGHLMYTDITGHGFRNKVMRSDERKDLLVDYPGVCIGQPEACPEAAADAAFVPELADVQTLSRPYNAFKSSMALSGWPVARTTDKNVELGAGFFWGDYSEAMYLEGEATFGKDNYFYLSSWIDALWPSLLVGYSRYAYKGTYGYGVDFDGVAETTDDITVVDVKFEQASDDVWLYATYVPSWTLWGGVGVDASRYSFRDTGDGSNFVPYTEHAGVGAFLEWAPWDYWSSDDAWINPRGGRRLYLDYAYRFTWLVDPEVAGAVYDDGELLERYQYQKLYGTYTEYIPMGWFGLTPRHTLQIDLEGGWIDRNVMSWDEFIAGGRHPYAWGNGTIGNNVQFSGYEGWSLTGETMLIGNLSYRFPLVRDMNAKVGPAYFESMYLQFFGTMGNLWSYRVDGPAHLEGYSIVADDPDDIRREQPFRDYASKNSPAGQENHLLSDAGVELRVRSFIWNDWDWDSFLRIAYGFNETAGYGDVNADMVSSSVARDANSELSDEVEPPTLRIYAGLGTGW